MCDTRPDCISLCYKIVSGLRIELDLYLPSPEKPPDPRPALVYFHGGGLTVGEKTSWFPSWLLNRTMAAGYAFISVNYRLLPPATGHDMIKDIEDLFQFIHRGMSESLQTRDHAGHVDAQRMAVTGTSAGGLCAYLAGIHAKPKPRAILSMYGMGGNFFTSHYLIPKVTPFFRGRELLDPEVFSEYLYPNSVHVSPVSSSPLSYYGENHPLPGYPSNPRMLLARLYLQLGTFIDYYTGEHEPSLSEKFRAHLLLDDQDSSTTWLPLVPSHHRSIFPQINLSAFPPTFLVHGSDDTAVPIQESLSLCEGLKSHGIPVILRVCDEMEHSFDYQVEAEQRWNTVFDEAFSFINAHLSSTIEEA